MAMMTVMTTVMGRGVGWNNRTSQDDERNGSKQ
jgi:hypothetical protein